MTNNNEWQLITILRKLQDAGLPKPNIGEFGLCWEFISNSETLEVSLHIDYNGFDYAIELSSFGSGILLEGSGYKKSEIDQAVKKLKQLLGGGDES